MIYEKTCLWYSAVFKIYSSNFFFWLHVTWKLRNFLNRMDRMNSASDFGADGLVQLKKACQSVLTGLITEEDRYKMGATKILFRAGIVAYLEKRRSDRLRACGILVQRMIRGWFYRRQYLKLRRAAICGQRLCRGYLARRRANLPRQTRAAITIQRRLRGFLQRRRYLAIRSTTLALQTYGRGALARSRYLDMVRRSKAIIIQKTVRGFLQRRRYERACAGILLLQCCWRRWLARRRFRTLRAEARSIEHVRNLNKVTNGCPFYFENIVCSYHSFSTFNHWKLKMDHS